MKKIDVTEAIRKLYADEISEKIFDEVKKEIQDGIPEDLSNELASILFRHEQQTKKEGNVVSLQTKSSLLSTTPLGETELLAAAGSSLANWFSQPMVFAGAGFTLDVRRVLGTEDEVDVYLFPCNNELQNITSLMPYVGKTIQVLVENNESTLLKANLYVDETACFAEGSGKLSSPTEVGGIKGKISISVAVK
jgi:hypothetical protein